MTETRFQHDFCIRADHPALPGHFPGQPLVPGVVLLDAVADALRAWRGGRLAGVPEAKFLRPLLPDEPASVHLHEIGDRRFRFEIHRGETLLARGMVEVAA